MTLRAAGTRHAELRGYSYDRADVSARALTHGYAQTLGVLDRLLTLRTFRRLAPGRVSQVIQPG